MRVAVVGGGISGLVAAYNIRRRLPGAAITIIEASNRLGGWLWTSRPRGGMLFENGCRGIRPVGNGAAAVQLISDLRLEPLALTASAASKNRYIWWRGRLNRLPSTLLGLLTAPLTRPVPWAVVANDLPKALPTANRPVPPHAADTGDCTGSGTPCPYPDTSVHAFATRHLGSRASEVLLDAALSGVYAGDATHLSARCVLRPLWRLDQVHGSLIVGALREALAARRARKLARGSSAATAVGSGSYPAASTFADRAAGSSSISFVDGMSTLVDALAAALGLPYRTEGADWRGTTGGGGDLPTPPLPATGATTLRLNTRLDSVQPTLGAAGATLVLSSSASGEPEAHQFDHVVLAVPARALAPALPAGSTASAMAASVPFASIAVVCLGFQQAGLVERALQALDKPRPLLGALAKRLRSWLKRPAAAATNDAATLLDAPAAGSATVSGGGFGYLVPYSERGAMPGTTASGSQDIANQPVADGLLGMVWDSCVFPAQQATAAGAPTRVSMMFGGACHDSVTHESSQRLLLRGLRAATTHMGLPASYHTAHVAVARDAIPQYTVGHDERVGRLERDLQQLYGASTITLLGNSFVGVGVADCIATAIKRTDALAARWADGGSGAMR